MKAFSTYGNVASIKIITTQTALNYAYVKYTNQESALEAAKYLNDAILCAENAVQKWNGSKVWGSVVAAKIHNASSQECTLMKPENKIPRPVVQTPQRDERYTLMIDHLSGLITEDELANVFQKHGELKAVKLFETQTAFNYAHVWRMQKWQQVNWMEQSTMV